MAALLNVFVAVLFDGYIRENCIVRIQTSHD